MPASSSWPAEERAVALELFLSLAKRAKRCAPTQHLDRVAGGADGADDLGLAGPGRQRVEDLLDLDAYVEVLQPRVSRQAGQRKRLEHRTAGGCATESGPGRSSSSSNSCDTERRRCHEPMRTGAKAASRCCASALASSRARRGARRSPILKMGRVVFNPVSAYWAQGKGAPP